MTADTDFMTLPEWAAWMGWSSAGMAYQAKKEGRLVMAPDGKRVLAAASKTRYLATADPSKSAVAARHASGRAAPAASAENEEMAVEPASSQDADSASSYDYQSAKARREHWAAEREENAARKEAGELLPLTDHVAAFANAGATLRAALESWSVILPPQLVGRDESAIRAVIADQVEQVLHTLNAQVNGLAAALDREAGA